MDAVKFLIEEHNKVRKMIAKISKGNFLTRLTKPKLSDAVRLRMFNKLCRDLEVHEKMEETVWYPVLRKELDVTPVIRHLIREEKAAGKAIKSFKKIKTQSVWEKKFAKFSYDVLHHAKDEETLLFPVAKKQLEQKQLNALGKKLKAYKVKHSKLK